MPLPYLTGSLLQDALALAAHLDKCPGARELLGRTADTLRALVAEVSEHRDAYQRREDQLKGVGEDTNAVRVKIDELREAIYHLDGVVRDIPVAICPTAVACAPGGGGYPILPEGE